MNLTTDDARFPEPDCAREAERLDNASLTSGPVRILNQLFKIHGDQRDAYFRSIIASGEYNEPLVNTFLTLIDHDSVCLDIGANLGLTSLLLSSLARKGRVYAFEPNPWTFEMLRVNLAANQFSNVSCHNLALSDAPGQLSFRSNEGMLAGSFAIREGSFLFTNDRFRDLITVEAISVDAFVEERKLDRLDFLKIDVEGFELEVLAGCAKTLQRYRPTVLVEFNSGTLVRFADVSPRNALDRIHSLFPETYLVDRGTGLLRRLGSEQDKDEFIYHNLAGGLVDNLVCTYPENRILARAGYYCELVQERNTSVAELNRVHAELNRVQVESSRVQSELIGVQAELNSAQAQLAALHGSLFWRLTGPLRRAARVWRKMTDQAA